MRDEVGDLKLRAVVYGPWTDHFEMIYSAKLKPCCEEIFARKIAKAKAGGLSPEEAEDTLMFLPLEPRFVTEWVIQTLHAGVPVGVAALLICGCDSFGQKWFTEQTKIIEKVGGEYSQFSKQIRAECDEDDRRRMKILINSYL